MKNGDRIRCPHCGEETFVKTESLLDGWKKTGEIFVCALCSGKLGDVPAEGSGGSAPAEKTERAASKLEALLGGAQEESKPVWKSDPSELRFCKDCAYLVKHPFRLKCSKFDRDVNPMDDCPSFRRADD